MIRHSSRILLNICCIFLLVGIFNSSCKEKQNKNNEAEAAAVELQPVDFQINGTLTDFVLDTLSSDTVTLYTFNGDRDFSTNYSDYNAVDKAKLTVKGKTATFELKGKTPAKGEYVLSISDIRRSPNRVPVLIMDEKPINLTASALRLMETVQFKDSPINQEYSAFNQANEKMFLQMRNLIDRFQIAMQAKNEKEAQGYKAQGDSLSKQGFEFLNQYASRKDIIGNIARMSNFKEYEQSPLKSKYPDAKEYFIQERLKTVDFKDPINGYILNYFSTIYGFSDVLLTSLQYPVDEFIQTLEPFGKQIPAGSKSKEVYYQAILAAIRSANEANPGAPELYLHYGKAFLEEFPKHIHQTKLLDYVAKIESSLPLNSKVGDIAPDIVLKNPQKQEIKLSSLRGKYVLIDFWASWCRPCRAENPNVVKLYKQYKDKGFAVFSVSLDEKPNEWTAAIAKDGLTWPDHVCDFQVWLSTAAKNYGVKGIPKTILIDPKGKIIAKDLRGKRLEKRLAQLLDKPAA
jgi:peroxiredoxin